ncbi:Nucleolar protein 14 [Nymphaea thermarum]|nr:Nucleolar protein 14 [Nymphaea thermarum]
MAKNAGEKADAKKKNKKRKSSSKKLLLAPHSVAMKASAAKPNPFESIWTRRKFDVLGKKRKGEEIRMGSSRSKARKETLLEEYQQSAKSSKFLDRRIGEKDVTLEEMDKSILRFQRERLIKMKRKSKYNLSDAEDDEYATDMAGSFSNLDDFKDDISLDEDDDKNEKNMFDDDGLVIRQEGDGLHDRGPMPNEENRQKTKKEVMEEIILKSKFHKAQKAKDKEEDEQLMNQLDKDFISLAQSEVIHSLIRPGKMNAVKALLNEKSRRETGKGGLPAVDEETLQVDRPDAYDRLVKEMVMDVRARPSDRTKTPEEIAQEKRTRLEELEVYWLSGFIQLLQKVYSGNVAELATFLFQEERKKRMLATEESDDDGSDSEREAKNLPLDKPKWISGEDLGDSFDFDEEAAGKGWVDEVLERGEAHDASSAEEASSEASSEQFDSDSEQQFESAKDWEQSDDELFDTGKEEDDILVEDLHEEVKDKKQLKLEHQKEESHDVQKKPKSKAAGDGQPPLLPDGGSLPFIIEAPADLKQLCSLLDGRSDSETVEAINRIRKCNAISLAAENRRKMQVFYGVLLQYFAVLANQKPVNFKRIDLLCSIWPSLKTLLMLRLWSIIYPCSDYRHVVMTPAVLLMCEYLMRCPIVTGRDIAVGSFLCSLLLCVCRQSRKLCPEAINFLKNLLMAASASRIGPNNGILLHGNSMMEPLIRTPWLHLSDTVTDLRPLDLITLMDLPAESSYFSSDSFRAGALFSMTETLRGFVHIYDGISSFPELFGPVRSLLSEVSGQEKLPELLRNKMIELADTISKKSDELLMLRQPVQMRKQRPVPIKQFNPKFEENYVKGRDYDPDRERAEKKKFLRQLKRESRGAARELRKDNQFLAAVKDRERALLEEERAEKYKKARAFLEEQEHAFNLSACACDCCG